MGLHARAAELLVESRDRTDRENIKADFLTVRRRSPTNRKAAQIGFIIYSVLVGNGVFIFTNSVLLLISLVGLTLMIRDRGWKDVFGRQASPAMEAS